MRNFFIAITIVLTLFFSQPVLAGPDINSLTEDVANKSGYETAGVTDTTLSETVGRYIKVVLSLTGTIFLVLMVYAGFLWMTAQGKDEQVTKAKGIITTATIGLIVVLAAYSITAFIVWQVGGMATTGAGQVGGPESDGGFWQGFSEGFGSTWSEFWGS